MMIIAITPARMETQNPRNTRFPYSFSPNRYAIDAFTILLDITAMRIVVDAIMRVNIHSLAHSE
jgi:hypothetical protein